MCPRPVALTSEKLQPPPWPALTASQKPQWQVLCRHPLSRMDVCGNVVAHVLWLVVLRADFARPRVCCCCCLWRCSKACRFAPVAVGKRVCMAAPDAQLVGLAGGERARCSRHSCLRLQLQLLVQQRELLMCERARDSRAARHISLLLKLLSGNHHPDATARGRDAPNDAPIPAPACHRGRRA